MSNDSSSTPKGGRNLAGDAPAESLPAAWRRAASSNTNAGGRPTGIGRIGAWSGGASAQGPGGDDDDEEHGHGDHDQDREDGESWFAGGERSGISVENPGQPAPGPNVVRDILRKAAEAGGPPVLPPPTAPPAFSGSGRTLGSDNTTAQFVSPHDELDDDEDEDDQEVATRHITFWRDGFSIEDGPLLRYDEPNNQQLLDEINTGHAPPQILNVRVGQPVELRVTRRTNDEYEPPPKKPLAAFEGAGQRLGGIAPQVSAAPSRSVPGDSSDRASMNTHFEVDQNLPTTSVQIRLSDGTRLLCRMNLHHTVGDIRAFINASRANFSGAAYTIQTTFPSRTLDDDNATIEQAGLKGSVVVQRMV